VGVGSFAICAADVVADMNEARTAGENSVSKPLIRTAILRGEAASFMDPIVAVLEMEDVMRGWELACRTR